MAIPRDPSVDVKPYNAPLITDCPVDVKLDNAPPLVDHFADVKPYIAPPVVDHPCTDCHIQFTALVEILLHEMGC